MSSAQDKADVPPKAASGTRSRWRKVLLGIGVLLALAVAAYFVVEASWRAEYESRLAALRAVGEPVEMTDLASPPVPEEENAAPLLLEAKAIHDESEVWSIDPEIDHPQPREEWGEEAWQAARKYVDALEPFGEKLDEAFARRAGAFKEEGHDLPRFPVDNCLQRRDHVLANLCVVQSCRDSFLFAASALASISTTRRRESGGRMASRSPASLFLILRAIR